MGRGYYFEAVEETDGGKGGGEVGTGYVADHHLSGVLGLNYAGRAEESQGNSLWVGYLSHATVTLTYPLEEGKGYRICRRIIKLL